MGWRVSLYKADKETPINIIYEEDEKYPFVKINGEQITYDTATDAWCYLKNKNEAFKKEIVNLFDNEDCDYYSITKDGFKMIILEFRRRIIEYMEKALDLYEHPEKKDKIEHWNTIGLVESFKHDLMCWQSEWVDTDGNKVYSELNFTNPNIISGSWSYKNGIFDMMYIYKTFDWENYTMVVYGG